jgi:hypothetical protein
VQAEIREAAEKLKIAGTDLKEQGAFKKANKPVREYKTVSRRLKEDFQNTSNQIFHSALAEQKKTVVEYTGQFSLILITCCMLKMIIIRGRKTKSFWAK